LQKQLVYQAEAGEISKCQSWLYFQTEPGIYNNVDGYIVKMKDRVVLSGLFNKEDTTLPVEFTSNSLLK
jgi:hypothetical protein